MAAVYTERFLVGFGASVTHAYWVPSGKRAVITSFMYSGYNAPSGEVWLGVNGYWPFMVRAPGAYWGGALQCRAPVYQGQQMAVQSVGSGSLGYCVGGYLFDEATLRDADLAEVPAGPGWHPHDERWESYDSHGTV